MTDSSQESQPNLVINLIMGTTSDKLQIRNILFWWIFDFLIRVLYYSNFLDSSGGKESTCSAGNTGDLGSVPGSGRCPGGGSGHPLPYSYLQNSMDRGARGLQSMWLQRVGHDWATKHTYTHIIQKHKLSQLWKWTRVKEVMEIWWWDSVWESRLGILYRKREGGKCYKRHNVASW